MTPPPPLFSIRPVQNPADLTTIRHLFTAYALALNLDLTFQDFSTELATLPGKYAPPSGEILLAFSAKGEALGCVALRPLEPKGCCEMKRLYVSPQARRMGLGRGLVERVLKSAREKGYMVMKLDTLPEMVEAIRVYESFGFVMGEKYYDTPIEGTVFFELRLDK
ncbi:MAG: hypothetical protein M1835_005736 [Candelina submexicana]|nr:MAG: hypothetical protein M1835_005736 [Candelina submexicana]